MCEFADKNTAFLAYNQIFRAKFTSFASLMAAPAVFVPFLHTKRLCSIFVRCPIVPRWRQEKCNGTWNDKKPLRTEYSAAGCRAVQLTLHINGRNLSKNVTIFYTFGVFFCDFPAVKASARPLGRKYAIFENAVTRLIYTRLTLGGLRR